MWAAMRPSFDPGGAGAIYLGIASVMKSRILRREWPLGTKIPTIDEISEEFGVARATARQALHVLVSENLISSHRGRGTFVVYEGPLTANVSGSILEATSPAPPKHSIEILAIEDRDYLPDEMKVEGVAAQRYKRISKIHSLEGVPYGFFEVFVASDIFERFPKGAEKRQKLAWLMREQGVKVTTSHERLTVHPADMEEARHLRCQLAQPIARLNRIMLNEKGCVVYAAYNSYRGDLFKEERKLTVSFSDGSGRKKS